MDVRVKRTVKTTASYGYAFIETDKKTAQSAGAVEYTDCISTTRVLNMTLKPVVAKLQP